MVSTHEHVWQEPRYSHLNRMLIQLCECGVIKRTTHEGTEYGLYDDQHTAGYPTPDNHPASEDDLNTISGFAATADRGVDQEGIEHARKRRMTPEDLSVTADRERLAADAAIAEHGHNSNQALDATAVYEQSLDILLYGDFAE